MKIKIDIDNLDEAIEQLDALAKKLEQFPSEVAMESASNIPYKTKADIQPGLSRIIAAGDQIAFEEYGAGFSADTDLLEMDGKEIITYPGVWSEDHAQTFQRWDGNPDDYPYNRKPKGYMRKEAERLKRDTERKARQYFDH